MVLCGFGITPHGKFSRRSRFHHSPVDHSSRHGSSLYSTSVTGGFTSFISDLSLTRYLSDLRLICVSRVAPPQSAETYTDYRACPAAEADRSAGRDSGGAHRALPGAVVASLAAQLGGAARFEARPRQMGLTAGLGRWRRAGGCRKGQRRREAVA